LIKGWEDNNNIENNKNNDNRIWGDNYRDKEDKDRDNKKKIEKKSKDNKMLSANEEEDKSKQRKILGVKLCESLLLLFLFQFKYY